MFGNKYLEIITSTDKRTVYQLIISTDLHWTEDQSALANDELKMIMKYSPNHKHSSGWYLIYHQSQASVC